MHFFIPYFWNEKLSLPLIDLGQTYTLHIDPSYLGHLFFENPTWGSKDIERTQNTVIRCLTLNYDLEPTLVKHRFCTSTHWLIILDICAELFENPTRGLKYIERTQNTVIQYFTLNYDLDLEPSLVKHKHCTSTHHTWHLCRVIWKSHKGFKRYRADTKAWRTDRRTERQTTAKNNMSPHYMWGDIIYGRNYTEINKGIFQIKLNLVAGHHKIENVFIFRNLLKRHKFHGRKSYL